MDSVFLRLFVAVGLWFAGHACATSIWFADETRIHRFNTDSIRIELSISQPGVEAAALDRKTGTLWTVTGATLYRVTDNGQVFLAADLSGIGLRDANRIALSSYDGSLWVANSTRLAHFRHDGALLGTYATPAPLKALYLSHDESVWAVGETQLWHYSAKGVLLSSVALSGLLPEQAKHLAVDAVRNGIWVGGKNQLAKLSLENPLDKLAALVMPSEIEGLALDGRSGMLFAITSNALYIHVADGALVSTVSLTALNIGEPESLAYDPASGTLWLGAHNGLYRFAPDGRLLTSLPLNSEVEAIAVAPLEIRPAVQILQPPPDALTSNAMPEFVLSYDALCMDAPCGFDSGYLRSYRLSALLNDIPVGAYFSYDPLANRSQFVPGTRLPDGNSRFIASVTDGFGHTSAEAKVVLSVDTVPPRFLAVSPLSGSMLMTPSVTIQGTVDDANAKVVLENAEGWSATGANPQGVNFSFPIVLKPGLNSVVLTAIDTAGNQATYTVSVTFNPVPPPIAQLINLNPVSLGATTASGLPGAVTAGARVVISNTRTGAETMVKASAEGTFSARIGAKPGDVLGFVAVDSKGYRSSAVTKQVPIGLADRVIAADGHVTGTLIDAQSGMPLGGVVVKVRGGDASSISGPDGRFALALPGNNTWALFFKLAGHIEARRDVYVRPGGDSTAGRISLLREATGAVTITPAGGVLSDASGNVQVVFPSGAVAQDTQFSATWIPTAQAFPLRLPERGVYAGGVQMGPEHHVFEKPVTMRIRNTTGRAPGAQVTFAFAAHDEEDPNDGFYDQGVGTVSADGQFVEFQVTHFSCMTLLYFPPLDESDGEDDTLMLNESGGGGGDPCAGANGTSWVGYCRGNLRLQHDLPSFFAFGRDEAPTLVYDSSTASQNPLVSAKLRMQGRAAGVGQPAAIRAQLSVEGAQTTAYVLPGSESASVTFQWNPVNGRGQRLASGAYPFTLDISGLYPSPSNPYGGTTTIGGSVVLNDLSGSPFGAGWNLAELARLYRNPDGSFLFTQGAGKATRFDPEYLPEVVASGFADSRSVAAAPDGTLYVASYQDGTITRIDRSGARAAAASGLWGVKGIGVAPDNVLYAVTSAGEVYRIVPGVSVQRLARLAGDHFDDLAVSPSGEIFVLDGGFGLIHKLTPSGVASVFFGNNPAVLANPMSLAFDAAGNLYVSSNNNNLGQARCGSSFISRFDQLGGHTYFRVGLNSPRGLSVDARGNVYVADYECNGSQTYAVKRLPPSGETGVVASGLRGDLNVFGLSNDLAASVDGGIYLIDTQGALLGIGGVRPPSRYTSALADFSEIRQNGQGGHTLFQRDGTQLVFGANGLHLETRAPQGFFWRYAYDAQGRLTSRTNPAGHAWAFVYGANGLARIVDPAGRGVDVTVDGGNNLVNVTEPGGSVMSYVYDAQHRIVSKTDSRGVTAAYTYGPTGNLTAARQANGEVRRFVSGRARTSITPGQAAASSLAAPLPAATVSSVEDTYTNGAGQITRMRTSRFGIPENIVDSLGNQTLALLNTHNQPSQTKLANGETVNYRYDEFNRLISRADSVGEQRLEYDALHRVTGVSSLSTPRLAMAYDGNYNLTQLTLGTPGTEQIVVNTTYNAYGQPVSKEVGGKVTRYEYDTDGRLLKVIDPLGQATLYGYDAAGNTASMTDATGQTIRFEYDEAGRMTAQIDPAGNATRFAWQAACATCGRTRHLLVSVTDAMGRATRFEYDALGQITAEIDPAGGTTRYSYDMNRNLVARVDRNGGLTTLAYDALDRLTRRSAPGQTTDYAYDSVGNMTLADNSAARLAFAYDSASRLTGIQGSGVEQVSFAARQTYDGYDRHEVELTTSGGTLAQYASRNGLRQVVALGGYVPEFKRVDFSYDNLGRRIRTDYSWMLPPDAAQTLDDASRLTGMSGGAYPGALSYVHDPAGRRIARQFDYTPPPSLSASLSHATVSSSVLSVTGSAPPPIVSVAVNGQPLALTQGVLQDQVTLNPGVNALTVTADDASGNRVTRSLSVTYAPQANGLDIVNLWGVAANGDIYAQERTATDPPALVPFVFSPDSGTLQRPAWLSAATDVAVAANGEVYSLQGALIFARQGGTDRLLADLSGAGTVDDIEAGPDGNVYAAVGVTLYQITPAGAVNNLVSLPPSDACVAQWDGRVPPSRLILSGSIWGLVAANPACGSFHRIESNGAATELAFTADLYWDGLYAVDGVGGICVSNAPGGVTCTALNGAQTTHTLSGDPATLGVRGLHADGSGALYAATADNLHRIRDGLVTPLLANNLVAGTLTLQATPSGPASLHEAYQYDPAQRLAAVSRDGQIMERYAYDAVGNRLNDAAANDYAYDPLNRLVQGAGAGYTYDANGNRLTKTDAGGTTRYTWDGENRLARIDFPDGGSAAYAYDPFGRRISKTLTDAQGNPTLRRYVYDGPHLVMEFDGQDNLLARYQPGLAIDEPLTLTRNGETYVYHRDGLGSVIALSDSRGHIVQRYRYDAWGKPIHIQDPAFKQPFLYTGREWDEESGLYYYRARYYDPGVGRFLSEDPIGLAGGINRYAYVEGNPLNLTDPLGLESFHQVAQTPFKAIANWWKNATAPTTPAKYCATAECVAGLSPAPSDLRPISEVEKGLCKLNCQFATSPFVTACNIGLGGGLPGTAAGFIGKKGFCSLVCN